MEDLWQSQPVLAALSPQARQRILGRGLEVAVPRGSTIYRNLQAPRWALVLTGRFRVYLTSSDGRQVTVRYAQPGDLLGVAVAVSGPSAVSVQALSDSNLLLLDPEDLRQEAKREGKVAWAIAEELGARLAETLEHVSLNAFGTVRERVALHLLRVATPGKQGQLVANITQKELAEAAGTVREVVSRVLRQFQEANLLRLRPGGAVLLQPESLRTLGAQEASM